MTLRVPQENYESFLQAAAQTGNLVNQSQQAEDITTQYMDLEARLANLQAQRERLLQLQAQADTLADLLEIESSLNEVQYQLESWQSQMNWYEDQIQCCTVYLSLNEVQTYSPRLKTLSSGLGARLLGRLAGLCSRCAAAGGLAGHGLACGAAGRRGAGCRAVLAPSAQKALSTLPGHGPGPRISCGWLICQPLFCALSRSKWASFYFLKLFSKKA